MFNVFGLNVGYNFGELNVINNIDTKYKSVSMKI